MQEIKLTVNGRREEIRVQSADRTLLTVLREDLGLVGTKEGCSIGVCGACTVILDSEMVSSCIELAVLADGAAIQTVEGLGNGPELDPVQRAFVEKGGLQCGICTPGQIMAARALLNATSDPTEQDVREWMTGNLCRCTGYYKIIEAVMSAAEHERTA